MAKASSRTARPPQQARSAPPAAPALPLAHDVLIVGGGLLLVRFAPGLESLGPWIAASSYIIALALAMLARWLSGKWRTMDLLGHAAAGVVSGEK